MTKHSGIKIGVDNPANTTPLTKSTLVAACDAVGVLVLIAVVVQPSLRTSRGLIGADVRHPSQNGARVFPVKGNGCALRQKRADDRHVRAGAGSPRLGQEVPDGPRRRAPSTAVGLDDQRQEVEPLMVALPSGVLELPLVALSFCQGRARLLHRSEKHALLEPRRDSEVPCGWSSGLPLRDPDISWTTTVMQALASDFLILGALRE